MTKFVDSLGLKRLVTKIGEAVGNGTWLPVKKGEGEGSVKMGRDTSANGEYSHAEGRETIAMGDYSHAEGGHTTVSGIYAHAQGTYNYDDPLFIDMVGVGINTNSTNIIKQNASVIYVGRDSKGRVDPSNPKNGYQYLIGIGGYQGQAIGTDTKSIQEVIEDFESRISVLENSL